MSSPVLCDTTQRLSQMSVCLALASVILAGRAMEDGTSVGLPGGCFEVNVWKFADGGGSVLRLMGEANQLLDASHWDNFEVHHLPLYAKPLL